MGQVKKSYLEAKEWYEDMPDLMGVALQQAEREFLAMQDLDRIQEATDLPLWIQLELDLWEGQHGINEATYWDVGGANETSQRDMAGRGSREVGY
jgi:hypothetical protein